MKHIITVRHEVEATDWEDAVERVLRDPVSFVSKCVVKPPRRRLVHVTPSSLVLAQRNINIRERDE